MNRIVCCKLVLLMASLPSVNAGDLVPPEGPIAPTMKPLSDIEPRMAIKTLPFAITEPGSYYFAGNLRGVAGNAGIKVTVSDVSIDLCGFTLAGVEGSLDGIATSQPGLANLIVRNGVIRGWGERALNFSNQLAKGTLIENVQAVGNGTGGLDLGNDGLISGCTAIGNGGFGIRAQDFHRVMNCVSKENSGNTGFGFRLGKGCVATDCVAALNQRAGFMVSSSGAVSRCSALSNNDEGFRLDTTCRITDCVAADNGNHGIYVYGACLVANNLCRSNGEHVSLTAGVFAYSYSNRIEGNQLFGNGVGVRIEYGGNLIIGNSFDSNNQNFHYGIEGSVPNMIGSLLTASNMNSTSNPHANYLLQ